MTKRSYINEKEVLPPFYHPITEPEPSQPNMSHYSVLAANVLPNNVLEAGKTAPDDALAELPTLGASNFAFPLPCRFRLALIDSLFLPACGLFVASQLVFFFAGFGSFDFLYRMLPNLLAAILTGLSCFCFLKSCYSTNLLTFTGFVVCSVMSAAIAYALGSWQFQLVIAFLGVAFFLDRFLLHAISIRTAIPCSLQRGRVLQEILRSRWNWSLNSVFSLWTVLIPTGLWCLLAIYHREDTQADPYLAIVRYREWIPALFCLIPILLEPFRPLLGQRYLGPVLLVKEFWAASVSFFFYNRSGVKHPAVFHSPAGTAAQRTLLAMGLIFIAFPLLTPRGLGYSVLKSYTGLDPKKYSYLDDVDAVEQFEAAEKQKRNQAETQKLLNDVGNDVPGENETPSSGMKGPARGSPINPPPFHPRRRRSNVFDTYGTAFSEYIFNRPMYDGTGNMPKPDPPSRTFGGLDEFVESFDSHQSDRPEIISPTSMSNPKPSQTPLQAAAAREQQAQKEIERLQEEQKKREEFESDHDSFLSLAAVTGIVLALIEAILPALAVVTFIFFGSARLIAELSAAGFSIPPDKIMATENWSPLIERLHNVDDGELKDHILWGLHTVERGPVLVPRSALKEHVHFLGDTGSGKTALGISPLVSQLIAAGDCSVLIIDLKGDDQTLFDLLRLGAQQVSGEPEHTNKDSADWNYPFRFFSSVPGAASHGLNPFLQRGFTSLTDLEQTDLISVAMGLQYGTDYGRKFFGDANFHLLLAAIKSGTTPKSFSELAEILKDARHLDVNRETLKAASNIATSVARLGQVTPLNFKSREDQHPQSHIDLMDLFQKPQALFCSLPGATGSVVNSEIARLILFSLINAAQKAEKPRRQVYVVIDEFQRMVSNNVEALLQMARSHDISLILANQCLGDLKLADADLTEAVTNNTRIRQIFSISSPEDLRDLSLISGERFSVTRGWGFNFGMAGVRQVTDMFRETPTPKLRINDLIDASNHPSRSIFLLRRSEGMAQYGGYPFVLQSCYHIPANEYQRRRNSRWPEPTSSTDWEVDDDQFESLSSEILVNGNVSPDPVAVLIETESLEHEPTLPELETPTSGHPDSDPPKADIPPPEVPASVDVPTPTSQAPRPPRSRKAQQNRKGAETSAKKGSIGQSKDNPIPPSPAPPPTAAEAEAIRRILDTLDNL